MGRRGQSSPAFVYPPATDAKAARGTPRSDVGVGTAHRPTRPHDHRPRTLRPHAVPLVRMRVWAPPTCPPASDANDARGTPRSEVGVGTAHLPTGPHDRGSILGLSQNCNGFGQTPVSQCCNGFGQTRRRPFANLQRFQADPFAKLQRIWADPGAGWKTKKRRLCQNPAGLQRIWADLFAKLQRIWADAPLFVATNLGRPRFRNAATDLGRRSAGG